MYSSVRDTDFRNEILFDTVRSTEPGPEHLLVPFVVRNWERKSVPVRISETYKKTFLGNRRFKSISNRPSKHQRIRQRPRHISEKKSKLRKVEKKSYGHFTILNSTLIFVI